ncbi:hypothetical protein ACTZWT_23195 [Rhodopseudomonas sp. NSM]|uniref:hypothetical protein n=1 Tax=Rhodopseudomonas sp. NSM TaxID=3457630 RepID=UPI0040371FC5
MSLWHVLNPRLQRPSRCAGLQKPSDQSTTMTYQHPLCPPPRGADNYLATEARIVAEDDSHIAIMLRIPKSAIARNLAFLAALADVMPAADQPGAPRAAAS